MVGGGPQVLHGIGPPGAPPRPLGRRVSARRPASSAGSLAARGRRGRWAGTRRGRRAPAWRWSRPSRGRSREGAEIEAGLLPVGAGGELDLAGRQGPDQAEQRRRRGSRQGEDPDRRRPGAGGREQVGQAAARVVDRRRRGRRPDGRRGCGPRRSRPAGRGPPARRTRPRRRFAAPGDRALVDQGQQKGPSAAASSTATGSASRSSSRRQRAIATVRSQSVLEASWQPM